MKTGRMRLLMFAMGLFSQTQIRIIGSIAISELVMFVVAPFVLLSHMGLFKRDKVMKALNLLLLAFVGGVISSVHNATPLPMALRGIASPYGFWACVIVMYYLLRQSPVDFKWYLLGSAISFVVCTFVFQQSVEAYVATGSGLNEVSADEIMGGPIYWIGRLNGFVMWPIQGLYMQCPLAYAIVGSFVFGAWSLLTSSSGRSAALVAMLSSVLIAIARKSPERMKSLRRHVLLMLGILFAFVLCFKSVYGLLAEKGTLGEKAQAKFEGQTRDGKDLFHVVKGGRIEPFIGLYACTLNPLWGYGPWALDDKGIRTEFMRKFGNYSDYEDMLAVERYTARHGGFMLIPGHSAIIAWWLWYGILGVPIWLYVMYLVWDYFRRRIGAIPEFFGYFACLVPMMTWNLFFSPFGARVNWAFFLAMLLLNRTLSKELQQRSMRTWQ